MLWNVFECSFVEEKCIVNGWDASFTTDVALLQNNNSMSTAELLAGFFEFYAQFDFQAYVLCPRLGHAVDVASFIESQPSDATVKHFKVCLSSDCPKVCLVVALETLLSTDDRCI